MNYWKMVDFINKAKCEASKDVYEVSLLILKTGSVFIWEDSRSEKSNFAPCVTYKYLLAREVKYALKYFFLCAVFFCIF